MYSESPSSRRPGQSLFRGRRESGYRLSSSQVSAAFTDQRTLWNENTRTFERIQTARNLDLVAASGNVAGIQDAVNFARSPFASLRSRA